MGVNALHFEAVSPDLKNLLLQLMKEPRLDGFHRELLGYYREKYPHTNIWQVQKSMCYFDDAEIEPDPIILKRRTWEEVKALIRQKCQL